MTAFNICYISEAVRGFCVYGSLLLESSFLPCGIKNGRLLQYSHAYQAIAQTKMIDVCVRTRTVCVRILRNSVKTETFAPENDCTMKQNVNFIDHCCIYYNCKSSPWAQKLGIISKSSFSPVYNACLTPPWHYTVMGNPSN